MRATRRVWSSSTPSGERCVSLTFAGSGCVVGGTTIDATFPLGTSSATLHAPAPAARLTDATRASDVRRVGSMRRATAAEPTAVGVTASCLPGLTTGRVVAIARVSP